MAASECFKMKISQLFRKALGSSQSPFLRQQKVTRKMEEKLIFQPCLSIMSFIRPSRRDRKAPCGQIGHTLNVAGECGVHLSLASSKEQEILSKLRFKRL